VNRITADSCIYSLQKSPSTRAELTDAEREAARAADADIIRFVYRVSVMWSAVENANQLSVVLVVSVFPSTLFLLFAPQPSERPGAPSTPCQYCGALLLESEPLLWRCRNGTKTLDPLPSRIQSLVDRSRVNVNVHSWSLNYLFFSECHRGE